MKTVLGFNAVELGLVGIVTASSLYCAIPGFARGDILFTVIETIATITGILCVVLAAKGKRSGFIVGLVNVVGYSFISYLNNYYGEVMLNLLFYVPSNIVGFIVWKRNQHRVREREVQGRSMSWPQFFGSAAILAVLTVAYRFLLAALGGSMAMLDGFTTLASIFATILMVLRYAEQWVYWIAVDIVTVILWVVAADPVMIVMWSAYLANAVYGYMLWRYKTGKAVPFEPLVAKLTV